MERPDSIVSDFQEDPTLMDDAQDVCDRALSRMKVSSQKYGAAYTLADIPAELDAEIDDLVGWTALSAARIRRVISGRLEKLDGVYLTKFLKYHDVPYLEKLKTAIEEELHIRQGRE